MMFAIGIALLLFLTSVYGQYASTFPAPIPLFHKSPYLNAWLPANTSIYNQGDSPWTMPGGNFVDLLIAVRVDGTAYLLLGETEPKYLTAKTTGAYITSTRTILTMDAGPVRVNITYLTPIELNDWILHSLPFVYFSINAWSTDGSPHSIQLYSDFGGTYLSSNRENKMTWNTVVTSKAVYHQAQQSIIQKLVETNDMAEDGTQYFATGVTSGASLTWQSATYDIARGNFSSNGKLTNISDTNFRSIRNGWTSLAFALDFGSTTELSTPPVFALGLVRDPVMKYALDGTLTRSSLWWLRWSSVGQAIEDFLGNFHAALSRAITLDNNIVADSTAMFSSIGLSSAVAVNLTDLMILSVQQTVGSLEFTTVKSSSGQLAGEDEWRVFMKDLGSTQRVNPVDNLYASFPAFLYLDPPLAGKLLEPLLEFQVPAVSNNTNAYAAPDLGTNWPLVIGNNRDQYYLGVESCGSMLVMALAHARKSGDGRLIATYYNLLHNWADFLVTNSLQLDQYSTTSADWVINATSNLALKGIMGIYAMGQINKALGQDPTYYLDTAINYAQKWQNLALSSDHVMTQYGNTSSWGLLFNLYDPILLGANIIPQTIYETQASWYASQIPKASPFGLPFDSTQPNLIKAPWTLLTAASVSNTSNTSARDALIGMVHSKSFQISSVPQYYANPSTYYADSGNFSTGLANPAMGGMFAFLALNKPDLTIKLPSASTSSTSAIVGGVIGGLAAFTLILLSVYFLIRWRKHRKARTIERRPPIDEPRRMATPVSPMAEYARPEEVITPFPPPPPPIPSIAPPSYTTHDGKVLLAPDPSSVASVMHGVRNPFGDNGGARSEIQSFPQNLISGPDITSNTPPSYLSGRDQLDSAANEGSLR